MMVGLDAGPSAQWCQGICIGEKNLSLLPSIASANKQCPVVGAGRAPSSLSLYSILWQSMIHSAPAIVGLSRLMPTRTPPCHSGSIRIFSEIQH